MRFILLDYYTPMGINPQEQTLLVWIMVLLIIRTPEARLFRSRHLQADQFSISDAPSQMYTLIYTAQMSRYHQLAARYLKWHNKTKADHSDGELKEILKNVMLISMYLEQQQQVREQDGTLKDTDRNIFTATQELLGQKTDKFIKNLQSQLNSQNAVSGNSSADSIQPLSSQDVETSRRTLVSKLYNKQSSPPPPPPPPSPSPPPEPDTAFMPRNISCKTVTDFTNEYTFLRNQVQNISNAYQVKKKSLSFPSKLPEIKAVVTMYRSLISIRTQTKNAIDLRRTQQFSPIISKQLLTQEIDVSRLRNQLMQEMKVTIHPDAKVPYTKYERLLFDLP